MRRSSTLHRRWESCCCSCLPVLVCSSGCAVLYQLAYGDGPKIEAKYAGLKGKRVAVVCVMNSSTYGDGEVSAALADHVGRILRKKVDDIEVVRQEEVSDWMDTNEWDESDFVEIGRGVKADMVLAIDVDSFSVHESKTLLKGRSRLTTTVYDVKGTARSSSGRRTTSTRSRPRTRSRPLNTNWRTSSARTSRCWRSTSRRTSTTTTWRKTSPRTGGVRH